MKVAILFLAVVCCVLGEDTKRVSEAMKHIEKICGDEGYSALDQNECAFYCGSFSIWKLIPRAVPPHTPCWFLGIEGQKGTCLAGSCSLIDIHIN